MEVLVEEAVFVTMAEDAGPSGPAGAMLVRDGRIAAVGPAGAVRGAASPGARVVRLDGATVVPGLIDAHCHVADVGYLTAGADCSQPSAPDIPAVQARLREAAGRTSRGSWVTGSGYVEYKLREGRHPTRADLDQAVPDRPAVLYHTSLHACVLNTAALAEAGLADRQPDPPDGAFGRDSDSRLDGVVYEGPMFELFVRNLRADLARMDAAARARLVQMADPAAGGVRPDRGMTRTCARTACPRSPRRTRPACSACGSTGWWCTIRWTGCWRPDCGPPVRPAGRRGGQDLGRRRDEQPDRCDSRHLPRPALRLGHLVLRGATS